MEHWKPLPVSRHILRNMLLAFSALLACAPGMANQQNRVIDIQGVPLTQEQLQILLGPGTAKSNPDTDSKQKKKNIIKKSGKKGFDRSRSNPESEQELLEALKAGRIPRVKQLLKIGTVPDYKNYKGETPLGIAVSRGWASMVVELIKHGANVNEKGARGVTLLHVASSRGMYDVAKVLVNNGLDPSQRTDKNWTPLHIAARYGHWKLVQYFLSEGVDPDIRNSDGQTALGLARHLRHEGIVKILSRVTTRSSLSFEDMKAKKSKKRRSKK